jgi:gamma-glutamylcyclotransferase (GGCT)/AIG2-like uncharacterized protein YtfP
MSDIIFVYGTLRPSVKNSRADLFEAVAESLGEARVRGHLYNLGAYPGLVLNEASNVWVVGAIYRLHHPEPTLKILDEYEGATARSDDAYERALVTVANSEHATLQAWTYLYRGPLTGAKAMPSGDWADALR